MKQSGTSNQPIEIQDDTYEQADQVRRKQHEANRSALYKAHLGSQFDVALAVIKTELHGSEEEKDRLIKSRINKFFGSQIKTIDPENQHFRVRREPNYNSPEIFLVPNELILYGIDFISNKKIRKMFKGLDVEIKCLDDSHCKITFRNASDCEVGLKMNLKDQNTYKIKLENEEMEVPRGWFQLKPYNYLAFERKLWCRYAMTNQNDADIERSNDYYMMMQAKKQFEKSIKSEITEIRYLSIMMKFNFIDENGLKEKISKNRQSFKRNNRREHRREPRRGSREQRRDRNYDSTERRNQQRNSDRDKSHSYDRMSERSRNKTDRANRLQDLGNLTILSGDYQPSQRQQLDLSIISKPNSVKGSAEKKGKMEQGSEREEDSRLSFLLDQSSLDNGMLINNMINLDLESNRSRAKNEEVDQRISILQELQEPQDRVRYVDQTPGVFSQNKIEPKKIKKKSNVELISLVDK